MLHVMTWTQREISLATSCLIGGTFAENETKLTYAHGFTLLSAVTLSGELATQSQWWRLPRYLEAPPPSQPPSLSFAQLTASFYPNFILPGPSPSPNRLAHCSNLVGHLFKTVKVFRSRFPLLSFTVMENPWLSAKAKKSCPQSNSATSYYLQNLHMQYNLFKFSPAAQLIQR